MEAIKLHSSALQIENKRRVKESYLFGCLSDEQIQEVKKYAIEQTFSKGEHLYQSGEEGKYIYYLEQGSVKLYTKYPDHKEVIKSILHPQNLVGEEIFTGDNTRLDNAKVIDPEVRALAIDKEHLRILLHKYWDLNERFIELVSQKLHRTQERVEGLIVDDARKRVIDFLKYHAEHKGKKIGFELLIKHSMTQQDIANYTGTSRQTVTSILNDLRKTNKIYFKRNSILIRDIGNLQ